MRDPAEARDNFGCLVLFPVAIGAMILSGFAGAMIGRVAAPLVNIADLEVRLGFLAALDGLCVVSLVHVRLFQGESAHHHLAPSVIFLSFVFLGANCGHGHGFVWLIFAGVANGVVACAITCAILRFVRR